MKNRRVSLKYSRGMRLWSSDGSDIGRDNGEIRISACTQRSRRIVPCGASARFAEWPLSNIYNALTVRGA